MNTPTRERRKFHRRVQSAMARAYAPGREERMAAAQAKRDRKAEKRRRTPSAPSKGKRWRSTECCLGRHDDGFAPKRPAAAG
jgi:hypothetical protein